MSWCAMTLLSGGPCRPGRCGGNRSRRKWPKWASKPRAYCVPQPNATSTKRGKFPERAKMSEQAKRAVRGHVSSSGRLSLPAEFRKAVGLERGGNVIVELDGNDIRIRTVNEAVARAQAIARHLFADKPGVSADDFVRHR